MTLYRNLGSITFQCETDSFQIFSSANETLILQFKNYQEVDLTQLNELLSVYQLILKEDTLLEIYSEKNKPSSILIHKAIRVGFEKINIQLLCRIIKEMVVSIFHSKKVTHGKFGEINKEMFFQIDGELRYLYFPITKPLTRNKSVVTEVLQFFNSLKDEKQVSHRLLLKKISKCTTLEEILEQTEYFLNIYHAKQSHTMIPNSNMVSQDSFLGKNISKGKFMNKILNQNTVTEFRHSTPFGQTTTEAMNQKGPIRRKYNLFKSPETGNFRNTVNAQSSPFNSNTWRKPTKQNFFINATNRSSSKAVHIDLKEKGSKNQSVSLFNRTTSVNQSPKKLSNSKRKGLGMSLHTRYQQKFTNENQSFLRQKQQQRKQVNITDQSNRMERSTVSKNLNQSQCSMKKQANNQQIRNSQSSEWMKQTVYSSLEKWREKENSKVNIFTKIKDKDREGSTQVDSRSKFVEKHERPSYDLLRESNISSIHPSKGGIQNQTNKMNQSAQTQSFHPVGSERKLKKGNLANRSAVAGIHNLEKQEIQKKEEKNEDSDFEFCSKNNFVEKFPQSIEQIEESLQEINLCKSSIEHLAMKNKEQSMRQSQNDQKAQRKKTSIKQILQTNPLERNFSDESQTQRIQYSRCSKKNSQPQKQVKSAYETEINQYKERLESIQHEKQQIDHIGVAVVQTAQHLRSFESIFWQLPMFFLYKRFYQRRLKLLQSTNQLLATINSRAKKIKDFSEIQFLITKYAQQIQSQNQNIEESLKKLLKTVKKKIKKQYTRKQDYEYIDKNLHLDFTLSYDLIAQQFIAMYINSLMEAKSEFPELVFHIVEIFEAVLVWKGKNIETTDKKEIEGQRDKESKLHRAEAYFTTLLKKKEIKSLLKFEQTKSKGKK